MRVLLKAHMDLETSNRATRDGSIKRVFETLGAELKPEACYFLSENGKRTAYYVFDLKDPSQIPTFAEPLFHQLGAQVELTPVMTQEEVIRGLENWSKKR